MFLESRDCVELAESMRDSDCGDQNHDERNPADNRMELVVFEDKGFHKAEDSPETQTF